MAKGDKKSDGLFEGMSEAPKKYPPIEEPLSTEPPRQPDPGLVADLIQKHHGEATITELKSGPVRRKLDPELKAMDEVCEVLEEFPPEVQMRILNWAMNKFFPAKTANKVPPNGTGMVSEGP